MTELEALQKRVAELELYVGAIKMVMGWQIGFGGYDPDVARIWRKIPPPPHETGDDDAG